MNSGQSVQHHKTVYFSDLAEKGKGRKGLTIAFGPDDLDLFRSLEHLSSARLRGLLGTQSFEQLESAANSSGTNINLFCKNQLQDQVAAGLLNEDSAFNDHLQTTFSGGRHDPLHNWFSYLEGYSPDFVWEIYSRYCDGATRILDPFSGSGTTPITVMGLGKVGLYSDVNPLCIFIIETKVLARKLEVSRRTAVSDQLRQLGSRATFLIKSSAPDVGLQNSYKATFGKSAFFDEHQYDAILRIRSVLDQIQDRDVAKFATMAAIRSLIPASLLIRRGDLRFRTPAESVKKSNGVVQIFVESLELIAADLMEIGTSSGAAECVGSTAIGNSYSGTIDGIITSPPYLNGTNYFRNTKIELWFIRELKSKSDLSAFRERAVTAGINDVTQSKSVRRGGKFQSDRLSQLVDEINRTAYDQRIPLMVQTYFSDMHEALLPAFRALQEGGRVCVDIGDSVYGGIHVPTDQLLVEIGEKLGFRLLDDVTLRERMSRSGQKLRQSLLVFEKQHRSNVRALTVKSKWEDFKTHLPHRQGEMASRNWGNGLHSLCSYQGKLKPAIASSLIDIFVGSNGRVLDPFSGVGTIPFEAAIRGAQSYGLEISPSAFRISDAKLRTPSKAEIDAVLADLESFISGYQPSDVERDKATEVRFNKTLVEYFHPDTFTEVLAARVFMQRHPCDSASFSFVHSALQHILHGNRPYALSRRSHPLTPYAPSGPFEYRSLLDRLRTKIDRSLGMDRGVNFRDGKVWQADCTDEWPGEVDSLDAVITSPPFFDSTRFYLGNWMRLWFSGWEISDFQTQPKRYIDERQKSGFGVYEPIIRQSHERLKSGGFLVLHLGESKKCDMAAELSSVAKPFFRAVDLFSENVEHCERHGIRDKGSVTAHQYLVLQK